MISPLTPATGAPPAAAIQLSPLPLGRVTKAALVGLRLGLDNFAFVRRAALRSAVDIVDASGGRQPGAQDEAFRGQSRIFRRTALAAGGIGVAGFAATTIGGVFWIVNSAASEVARQNGLDSPLLLDVMFVASASTAFLGAMSGIASTSAGPESALTRSTHMLQSEFQIAGFTQHILDNLDNKERLKQTATVLVKNDAMTTRVMENLFEELKATDAAGHKAKIADAILLLQWHRAELVENEARREINRDLDWNCDSVGINRIAYLHAAPEVNAWKDKSYKIALPLAIAAACETQQIVLDIFVAAACRLVSNLPTTMYDERLAIKPTPSFVTFLQIASLGEGRSLVSRLLHQLAPEVAKATETLLLVQDYITTRNLRSSEIYSTVLLSKPEHKGMIRQYLLSYITKNDFSFAEHERVLELAVHLGIFDDAFVQDTVSEEAKNHYFADGLLVLPKIEMFLTNPHLARKLGLMLDQQNSQSQVIEGFANFVRRNALMISRIQPAAQMALIRFAEHELTKLSEVFTNPHLVLPADQSEVLFDSLNNLMILLEALRALPESHERMALKPHVVRLSRSMWVASSRFLNAGDSDTSPEAVAGPGRSAPSLEVQTLITAALAFWESVEEF